MKNFFRSHKILAFFTALALLVCGLIAWDEASFTRGQLTAHFDIARGHYKILGYGLPAPGYSEYIRTLHDKYNVEFDPVAGCIVSQSLISYVNGYNGVSEAAANRKYGRDIIHESLKEANTRLNNSRPVSQLETSPID
jgi:hypothetical protein